MAWLRLSRLFGATATIIVTTLQDCVFLVPFVLNAPNTRIAIIHAVVFVSSFVILSAVVGLLTLILDQALAEFVEGRDYVFGIIGASLCWVFAAYLYYRSWRERQEQGTQIAGEQERLSDDDEKYGAIEEQKETPGDDLDTHLSEQEAHPWMLVSLTVLGALDEISYFPGLILGGIFTVPELCLGTMLASLCILIIVLFFLAPCSSMLSLLERIPLYGIVAFFAILLSLQVVWEILFQ